MSRSDNTAPQNVSIKSAFSALERGSARKYLDEFPKREQERGAKTYHDSVITVMAGVGDADDGVADSQDEMSSVYRAVTFLVSSKNSHTVHVEFYEYEGRHNKAQIVCDADCTCIEGVECAHCVAVMYCIIGGIPVQGIDVNLPCPVVSASSLKPKSVLRPPDNLPPPKDGAEWYKRSLAARNSSPEHGFARQLDALYIMLRSTGGWLQNAELSQIGVCNIRERWNRIRFWDKNPRDAWSMWLALAAYSRKMGFELPGISLKWTDFNEGERLCREYARKQEDQIWIEKLSHISSASFAEEGAARHLRLLLSHNSLELEERPAEQAPYCKLSKSEQEKIIGSLEYGSERLADDCIELTSILYASRRSGDGLGVGLVERRELRAVFREAICKGVVVTRAGLPFRIAEPILRWKLQPVVDGRYPLQLVDPEGKPFNQEYLVLSGAPHWYITADTIFTGPAPLPVDLEARSPQIEIPASALESEGGVALLRKVEARLPVELESRIESLRFEPCFRVKICNEKGEGDTLVVQLYATAAEKTLRFKNGSWWDSEIDLNHDWESRVLKNTRRYTQSPKTVLPSEKIRSYDRSLLYVASRLMALSGLQARFDDSGYSRKINKQFPSWFGDWIAMIKEPLKVELDPLLEGFRSDPVSASLMLECRAAEGAIDWFDIEAKLSVSDTTLTKSEIDLLLKAEGRFVNLPGKGWRRMHLGITDADDEMCARLGLGNKDFQGEPMRIHALQLADEAAAQMLSTEQYRAIRERADQIKARVTPPVPAALRATLRPYQLEGFHFLAYLAHNNFGGILADDMGLGKTVQALCWLLWLRGECGENDEPGLVVAPKSVVDVWGKEAARYAPQLRVSILEEVSQSRLEEQRRSSDIIVLNYALLRNHAQLLCRYKWHVVILDEGQCIKNPATDTARAAFALRAERRLVLSGTPIENRLLDLWSLMQFALPGVLGDRAHFQRLYNGKNDRLARTRLAARVRPFLLRRTKAVVAADLPERVEDEISCELEGVQKTLYQAELKYGRQLLLKAKTQKALAELRMHFLTSLLRLRQICCHPALIDDQHERQPSAKFEAFFEFVEPVLAERHKVLVFSQFRGVLDRIRSELNARKVKTFLLTGESEDRGALVDAFQADPEPSVFLISLRAGGFGLNLTSANYVVLFDPWWNPAVENQAIDRTHRIGQRSTVFAYRMITKRSIEEKIRELQRRKKVLVEDVLGEERFSEQLSLDDLTFLFSDE